MNEAEPEPPGSREASQERMVLPAQNAGQVPTRPLTCTAPAVRRNTVPVSCREAVSPSRAHP
jgi:hypothetical protein